MVLEASAAVKSLSAEMMLTLQEKSGEAIVVELFYKAGTSDKFYHVELSGRSLLTRWGRRGTDGTTNIEQFPTAQHAAQAARRKIDEKLAKGYRATIGSPVSPLSFMKPSLDAHAGEIINKLKQEVAEAMAIPPATLIPIKYLDPPPPEVKPRRKFSKED